MGKIEDYLETHLSAFPMVDPFAIDHFDVFNPSFDWSTLSYTPVDFLLAIQSFRRLFDDHQEKEITRSSSDEEFEHAFDQIKSRFDVDIRPEKTLIQV